MPYEEGFVTDSKMARAAEGERALSKRKQSEMAAAAGFMARTRVRV